MKQEYPVVVAEIRPTSSSSTYQVRVEQIFNKEVTNSASLLSFTMGGHEKFGDNTTKRSAWQPFSKANIIKFGLKVGMNINDIPGVERSKIVVRETTKPNTWVDGDGNQRTQEPKRAGKDGDILTYQGQPIYRNTVLVINGDNFDDVLLQHDKVETSAAVLAAVEALTEMPEVGQPDLPF